MGDFFKLKKIDTELQSLTSRINFLDINPINRDQEKTKVLNNPDYNPYFIYPKSRVDFDEVQAQLHSIDEDGSTLGKLLHLK